MKIAFFGNGVRATFILKHLLNKKYYVGIVITNENENFIEENSIKSLSHKHSVPIIFTENPNSQSLIKELKKHDFDLFILGGYSKILKEDIINIPKFFTINLHAGKLPNFRGSSPLNWALIKGEKEFSISIIKVNEGIDTGDILKEKKFKIGINDNINDLHKKANINFIRLIDEIIFEIENGSFTLRKQTNRLSAYYPLRFPNDGFILFDQESCEQVHNKIRALSKPYPCAFSYYNSKKIYFLKSELLSEPFFGEPGKIYRLNEKGILVCCKERSILITEYEFENTKYQNNFLKVYGQFLTVKSRILNEINA